MRRSEPSTRVSPTMRPRAPRSPRRAPSSLKLRRVRGQDVVIELIGSQFATQPRARFDPLAPNGSVRKIERLSSFGIAVASKKAALHHLREPRTEYRQS